MIINQFTICLIWYWLADLTIINSASFHISKENSIGILDNNQVFTEWQKYKIQYNLKFDEKEDAERKDIFADNLNFIRQHQRENKFSYSVAMNPLGHLRESELQLCYKPNTKASNAHANFDTSNIVGNISNLPLEVDWRKFNVVSHIKDQGQCGSCYAFSATGALESMFSIESGKSIEVSEQEIIDCSESFKNQGCDGGLMNYVFEYVKENGIELEESYPYKATVEKCHRNVSKSVFKISSYKSIPIGDELALQRAIAFKGPISVAIDAGQRSFRFYKEGVYHESKCGKEDDELNHGVLAVGYGSINGEDYYIVKNSWSTSWGNEGYILMSRNKDNNCGIATSASYPIF